jgi:hypothetical protein
VVLGVKIATKWVVIAGSAETGRDEENRVIKTYAKIPEGEGRR